jgi:4-hydroxy-3-polyprenylbenzoate decarboxylase
MAIALDLPVQTSGIELVDKLRKTIKELKLIPPVDVESGPVKENIHTAKDVNLFEFPIPLWHEQDGGRYIGTGDMVITKDPDTSWVNFGTYRVQVHNKNTAGMGALPYSHGMQIMKKYWAKGLSCPVAVVCGQDPSLFVSSAFPVPWGISEYDVAGSIRGKAIEVVKGEKTALPIPATAEIVLEGIVPPPEVETRLEGPFGEYKGYIGKNDPHCPVIKVQSILHRDNPLLHGCIPMKPPIGQFAVHFSAPIVWNALEKAEVSDVKGVWATTVNTGDIIVVSIKQRYPGHAKEAGLIVASRKDLGSLGRFVIIVDDDVDPSNTDDVLWALATRCDPRSSIDIVRDCWYPSGDPLFSPEKIRKGDFTISKAIINACKPYNWIDKFPSVNKISYELREKTMEKWRDLFKKR